MKPGLTSTRSAPWKGASLANAILTAVSYRTHQNAAHQLQTAERLWQEFDLHVER